ncbi:uncharacterized protein BO88DRAFT_432773 [Aspergillus vadensis CBS 113365]|uniref:Cell wall protein n=1 Tax=Aspergillus vadensis (strain CBS 113365 / IMI 142717 / IBT 24658) TaxID=1448311 RepID=A0A319BM67_ASPVC|nr:hypothetical protein BO88DRAFT_432773 [Aspergillus vadensis CBS 113365]PYH72989.1 hypothetical protein BO88DRAFT_432773 [Aspergillus vadensis CBS 113365]
MNLLPLLLTLTTFLLPLTAAFTSTFQNCQNLNRLNQTVHRVHPLLEKFSSVHASQSQTAVTTTTTTLANGTTITVTNTTSSAAVERIESVRALLLSSQEKIYGRLSNCSSDAVVAPRNVLVKGSGKRDDDDDDDGSCTLTDVLDQLVDTLECVLSFATGLLETILDGVFDLLKDVIEGVEKLL